MKKIIKWLSISIGAIGFAVVIALGIVSSLPATEQLQISSLGTSAKSSSLCEDFMLIEERSEGYDLWRPIAAGVEETRLYCVEPGGPVKISPYTREEIWNAKGDSAYCACVRPLWWENQYSTTYYICENEHYTETSTSIYGRRVNNLYDVAYITSFYPQPGKDATAGSDYYTTWSSSKQQAIWMSVLSKRGDPGRGTARAEGEALRQASLDYQDFYTKVTQPNTIPGSNKTGMQPVNTTDDSKVTFETDQETQTHKLGPFKINYVNGRYNGVAYGGISNMYLVDNTGKRIEIKALIRPNKQSQSSTGSKPYKSDLMKPAFFSAYEPGYGIENPNKVDYWDYEKYYPEPNEEFYVEFAYAGENTSSLKLHVDFQWLKCTTEICIRQGYRWQAKLNEQHYNRHPHTSGDPPVTTWDVSCRKTPYIVRHDMQDSVYVLESERAWEYDSIEFGAFGKYIPTTMKLGGFVYEDIAQTKENQTNGILDSNDLHLENIVVTLYDAQTKQPAKLSTMQQENPTASSSDINNELDYKRRTNSTFTDSNGYYEFRGLSREKKYYVMFTYNGQTYTSTDYLSNSSSSGGGYKYNSAYDMAVNQNQYDGQTRNDRWRNTSKGTESINERNDYDEKFSSIGSSPHNYESSNSLNSGNLYNNRYNDTFSYYELAGFTLEANGNYSYNANNQLVDSYYILQNGMVIDTSEVGYTGSKSFKEGIINQRIKEFIRNNRRYPTNSELRNQIYSGIAGGNAETWRKLQFIEDCKIDSYTKNYQTENKNSYDVYPIYNQFTTYVASGNRYPDNSYNGTYADNSNYQDHYIKADDSGATGYYYITYTNGTNSFQVAKPYPISKGGVTYKNVYAGQLWINQGLWRRQVSDTALRKDIYKAATKVNGRTEIYNYDKRQDENNNFWEIQVRMRDYQNYYASGYNRELYKSDYYYRENATNQSGKDLDLYVTYKITIRNQSQSILNQIDEVVDYYDKDYTYKPELSWVMYNGNGKNTSITDNEYYNLMNELNLGKINNAQNVNSSGGSKYDSATQSDMESRYNSVYVRGLENKKLATGESAYVYLTFKVNSDGKGPVILDDDNTTKENFSEINGYSTFYADGTKLPNNVTKNSSDVAGLIDTDSKPGNLELSDLQGGHYEKNFEDDTDRAKSIKVLLDEKAQRSLNGTIWDDQRTQSISDTTIGDGKRDGGKEIGVNGITVELVEKLANGGEHIWATATTGAQSNVTIDTGGSSNATATLTEDGKFNFANYIPGNYIIRYKYGHNTETVNTTVDGGKNANSYNGQDFKSTIYQKTNGIEVSNYTDPYYNIQASDAAGANLSDAKDIWSRREAVNNYSSTNVTNHKAEVLASPYITPEYNGTKYTQEQMKALREELTTNTNMVAETGIIVAEFEYNRTGTDGYNSASNGNQNYLYGNDKNGNYTLNNIDLGLTERPKAQLEIGKQVTHVKITLANSTILFDTTASAPNALWKKGEEYQIDKKKTNNKYEEYYAQANKDRYSYRDEVSKIVNKLYPNNGLLQFTMDEELMHGATIRITYNVKVKNVGEVDYTGQDFYYKATGASDTNKVTTAANIVTDYVANNLQFRQNDNGDNWKTITKQDLITNNNESLVNKQLTNNANQFNTIITTEKLNQTLKPGQETNQTLVLSQLITPQNKDDDLTYNNIVEIVKTSNTVGRRMAFSVVGNQDPTKAPAEVDSIKAEKVVILPPFGQQYLYYGIGVLVAIILIAGIVIIKKKVF